MTPREKTLMRGRLLMTIDVRRQRSGDPGFMSGVERQVLMQELEAIWRESGLTQELALPESSESFGPLEGAEGSAEEEFHKCRIMD